MTARYVLRAALALSSAAFAAHAFAPPASADPVDDLAAAFTAFRGLGHASVQRYRVPLRIPEDESAANVKVDEIWRAPSDLVLRARGTSTPGAVVRSLALYLEPMYVARTAILEVDWSAIAQDVRASAVVRAHAEAGGTAITLELPDSSATRLPEALRDVERIDAKLDARGRLHEMELRLKAGDDVISVACDYERDAPQPSTARWRLPTGESVVARTKFRSEHGLRLPAERRVTFPSRFDPKETEEIRVEYGAYELNPSIPDSLWSAKGSFRFDANGLVTNR